MLTVHDDSIAIDRVCWTADYFRMGGSGEGDEQ